ncbi:MAG: hypothetical protein AB1810_01405 [Pseudomonadota bacterium]
MIQTLQTPKQDPAHSFSLGASITDATEWLDSLPGLSSDEAASMILPVLLEANRSVLGAEFRRELLQRLNDLAAPAIAVLREKYLSSYPPMSTKKDVERVLLVRRLLEELGYGYKILIAEYARAGASDAAQQAEAIFFSLHTLGVLLLDHYAMYEPVGDNLWGELNLLYRIALKGNLQARIVPRAPRGDDTVESAYKHLVLLAVINPYRLSPGEVEKAYQILAQWRHDCALENPPAGGVSRGEVIIDLAGEEPPRYLRAERPLADLMQPRVVNVEKIKTRLAQLKSEIEHKSHAAGVEGITLRLQRDMLQRLLDGWRSQEARHGSRRRHPEALSLAIGLDACHELQGRDMPAASGSPTVKTVTGGALRLMTEAEDLTARGHVPVSSGKPKFGVIDKSSQDVWDEGALRYTPAEEKGPPLLEVKREDVSEGGYGLMLDQAQSAQLRVGDLVSLRAAGKSKGLWAIGDLRWLQKQPDGATLCGVRLLAGRATPLEVKALKGVGAGGQILKALLIPADGFDLPEASLLLPPGLYDTGTTVHLRCADRLFLVELGKKVESTHDFARFAYRILQAGRM